MGEGAGILVVEELGHALARGAKPFAELVGYGTTADAHHVTSGPEDGEGARGAAGGLGAIFAILALRDQVAPPTLNLGAPDPAGDGIDFVTNQARPMEMDYAISNGLGFGGVNASALFRCWTDELGDTSRRVS
jgi:3-oxoacyl-[acyl-carrier-protein] synthase II